MTDIVRYMVRHLGEPLTLEQLAQEFDLSKSGLHALFQKHTGRSPMDFFLRLKEGSLQDAPLHQPARLRGGTAPGLPGPLLLFPHLPEGVGISPKEYQNSEYFHYQE